MPLANITPRAYNRRNMSDPTIAEILQKLERAVRDLDERVGDLEDLRDLEAAIEENAGKPGFPWEEVKKELDIE